MGDHTAFRESTAFTRGCLYALLFSFVLIVIGTLALLVVL